MLFKRFISFMLVVVMLVPLINVGGVASADELSPRERLNEQRNDYFNNSGSNIIANVQSILEEPEFISLPADYSLLSSSQRLEIAEGVVNFFSNNVQYVEDRQVEYTAHLVYNLVKLNIQLDAAIFQETSESLFELFDQVNDYFPSDSDQQLNQIRYSGSYHTLLGVDKTLLLNTAYFKYVKANFGDHVSYESKLSFMTTQLALFNGVNGTSVSSALNQLYSIYAATQDYIQHQDSSFPPFALNLSKMSEIVNDDELSELTDWIIDNRPESGYYDTVAQVQSAFDSFFAGVPWLDQYNEFKKTANENNLEDIEKAITFFSDEQFLVSPEFKSLSTEDQQAVAAYLLRIEAQTSAGYTSQGQVQIMVEVAMRALDVMHQIGGPTAKTALDAFYTKQAERVIYFNDAAERAEFYRLVNAYLTSSDLEKRMTAYRFEIRLSTNSAINRVIGYTESAVELTPYLNRIETKEDMKDAIEKIAYIQSNVETYNTNNPTKPMEEFPLDFSEFNKLTGTDKNELAMHMLEKRPNAGYLSYADIQHAFDQYLNPDIDNGNKSDLRDVNYAREDEDTDDMIMAIEHLEDITLPQEYSNFTPELKKYVAKFLIYQVGEDYETESQVQYMIELAVQAQLVWEQKELSVLQNKLDILAQSLSDGLEHFNDRKTEDLHNIGQRYLELSRANKTIFAYTFLHLLAKEKLEGTSAGDIPNPEFILELLSTPYEPIENAITVDQMDQWLDTTMKDQLSGEQFFHGKKFDFSGSINLSRRVGLSNADKKELAEWVLEHKENGYKNVLHLQHVIDQFFTAPNVTADNTNKKLIGLDSTMEISFDGGLNWLDLALINRLELNRNVTVLVRYKAIEDELPGRALKFVFTAKDSDGGNTTTPPTTPTNPSTPSPSTSTPVTGGSNTTPAPATKQEQIVVDVNGVNGTNLTKTPITRTTETNGVIKDLVKMSEAIAKESVEKAKQLGTDTARIVIPDAQDAVSETRIELPKAAVKELNDGALKLEISTGNVVISVPTSSIAGFDQDLYFRVVPLKLESERKEVEERAKKERLIQEIAPDTNVRILARPVEIETNMQSREVTLTLPLRNSLPTDLAARQQALDNLAIYIEHSDGTKELIQGKLVKLTDNSEGIEFTVTKFSTFTLVVVDGLKASQSSQLPYIQGFGADFRPDALVTRAQMAAMLARNLTEGAGSSSAASVSYTDVSATHWAISEIQKAQSAGIMNGLSTTKFAPEGSITRAQMATIAYRWMQQQASEAEASFTDVSADLWASDAIAYVQSSGLMVGYSDGTFKPNNKLTRAEAVKVLNVLFNRTPLTGAVTLSFSDVPATHWAYADIEAAAQK
ncbi:S-layer homology domain-containing protein [Paenibacillus sp. ACRSA]|uniref:S-layer homology domain-containing protein n=1 Tax=Paenibacillus sp. ACRSA TaxID=2918211 RepID=UPI001EF6C217|nr:S-layer homology domain-containing protein [Paenibacillus sp. ACRSA]MCG7378173.1 S-layer homology domain-containing protein [Paenibacillus sp. ACRSA]